MGQAKNAMMEQQDAIECAKAYLCTIGVLSECSVHGYIIEGNRSLEESWGIAVNDWKRGQAGKASWSAGMALATFKEALASAYADNCGDCIGCVQSERE